MVDSAASPGPSAPSEKVSPLANGNIINGGTRRSGRTTKRLAAYQDPDSDDELFAPSSPITPPAKKIKAVVRRNPQREAVAAALSHSDISLPDEDEVLEAAFAPLTAEEREQWTGWTEVESEPVSLAELLLFSQLILVTVLLQYYPPAAWHSRHQDPGGVWHRRVFVWPSPVSVL